ncbi:MAG: M48 family metalloprotease, partial [Planctomycetota bacterium]
MWILIGFVSALALVGPAARAHVAPANWLTAGGIVLYLAGAALLARAGVLATIRSLAAAHRDPSSGAKRWHALAMAERVWLLAGSAGILVSGYADWINVHLRLAAWQLPGMWLAMAPFLAALLLSWLIGYRAHRAIRRRIAHRIPAGQKPLAIWSRRQYVLFQLRAQILFVGIPLSAIVLAQDVLWALAPRMPSDAAAEWMLVGGTAATAATVFLLAPAIIIRIWHTRPLPAGPLRDRLDAMCQWLKLRYRQIRVWGSHGVLANAAVMGFVARIRYILLSDALLDRLTPQEILAVFAHEAGHVIHQHML